MPCPVPRQPWHVICHHAAGPKRSPSWCAAALLTRFDFNVARVVHSSGRVHSGRRHGLRILHSARAEGLLSAPERGRVGHHLLLRVPLSRSGGRRRVEPRSSEGRQQGTAGRVAYVRPVRALVPRLWQLARGAGTSGSTATLVVVISVLFCCEHLGTLWAP